MKKPETSLLATLKTTDAYGDKYAADFSATSIGGKQFALVKAAVTATAGLGATQVSGGEASHAGVLDEVALRLKLHDDLLSTARAFAADAVAFQAQFVSLKLADTFIADLNQDIGDFETAIKAKGSGGGKKGVATFGIGKTIHDAGIALHVLNTIVPNTCANDPAKLAEWVIASHVVKHTPVPRPTPAPVAKP